MKKEEILELKLPCLEFLGFENIYSGSYDNFNFKVFPEVCELKVKVVVWLGCCCLEKSEPLSSQEFDLNEQGHALAQKWLFEKFENFNEEVG